MPSPFPYSLVISGMFVKKNQIEKKDDQLLDFALIPPMIKIPNLLRQDGTDKKVYER